MRLTPDDRKIQILLAAIRVAQRHGYDKMTREMVANEAIVSEGLVNRYYSNMTSLRNSVMSYAVQTGNAPVVAQGLVRQDPIALRAPEKLKTKCAASLLS